MAKEKTSQSEDSTASAAFPESPIPIERIPWYFSVSGLYVWSARFPISHPVPADPFPLPPIPSHAETSFEEPSEEMEEATTETLDVATPWWFQREELRLDVDGRYPQMTASGTLYSGLKSRVHWIARLKPIARHRWAGRIWYKRGDTSALPHSRVEIHAVGSWFAGHRKATVHFSGGAPNRVRTYRYRSRYFHPVELEFDTAKGTKAITQIHTTAHPNHPPALTPENLTLDTVFRRAGFDVKNSGGDGSVPLDLSGLDTKWSDMEMHDAMQVFWSRFANKAQWSMWVFFAALHEMGTSLGGIMFDDIGPNHRQGTAIFNDSFIKNPPAGDVSPAAWVQRMKFWTACHEMGHCFNLAHSWQKSLGTPWIPLANEPAARSFMNYPFLPAAGGQAAFFGDFEYRFSDQELLFMRHAPMEFVEMGNADWFDHHGFQQAETFPGQDFTLQVRANREQPASPTFQFLETPVLELKLTNVSEQPQLVDQHVLSDVHRLTVIVKKDGKAARQWTPYAHYCHLPQPTSLEPGKSLYESLFVAAGVNGWDLAEPGYYRVQVALHLDGQDVVSQPIQLRVEPPRNYDEERLAQDFFSDDVGRTLAFDGTRFLDKANNVLREAVDRFSDRRVAVHARIALGNPLTKDYKLLSIQPGDRALTSVADNGGKFLKSSAEPEKAQEVLTEALMDEPEMAAETLGHVDYKYYVDQVSDWLAEEGKVKEARSCQTTLHKTLKSRGVLDTVLEDVESRKASYAEKPSEAPAKKEKKAG